MGVVRLIRPVKCPWKGLRMNINLCYHRLTRHFFVLPFVATTPCIKQYVVSTFRSSSTDKSKLSSSADDDRDGRNVKTPSSSRLRRVELEFRCKLSFNML